MRRDVGQGVKVTCLVNEATEYLAAFFGEHSSMPAWL